jgi:hypothetical protein
MKLRLLPILLILLNFLGAASGLRADLDLSQTDYAGSEDYFQDILKSYKEIPSDLFKRRELRNFLSTSSAKKMRAELGYFRDQMIARYKAESKRKNPNYFALSKEISEKYKDWIRRNVDRALGADINRRNFALVAFGSLARDEVAGLFTDLEAAILVKDLEKNSIKLGRSVAANVSLWFNQSGENPRLPMQKKGFRPDEEANFPFNFALFARNMDDAQAYCMALKAEGSPKPKDPKAQDKWKDDQEYVKRYYPFEGTFAFITTPKNLAAYFHGTSYDFPFPVVLNDESVDTEWYKFAKQFMTNEMLSEKYIEEKLAGSPCKDKFTAKDALSKAAKTVATTMAKKEIGVISGFDSLGRNSIFLSGNKRIFDNYTNEKKKVLDGRDNLREYAMIHILHGIILKFRADKYGGQIFLNGKFPEDVTDVKRILYRFGEQVFSTLGVLYNADSQNVRDIINFLVTKGILGKALATKQKAVINAALGLRWKESILAGEQLNPNQNFLSASAYAAEVQKVEQKIADLNTQLENLVKERKQFELTKSLSGILNNKPDAKEEAAELAEFRKKQSEKRIRISEELVGANKRLQVLKALNPEAKDPLFTEKDLAQWRDVYSKDLQDLFTRLVYFVGGVDNLKEKNYIIANPDAFKDNVDVPAVDIEALMSIE